MGHLYPGMLDVSTDMTLVSSQFGGHMEVLEFDDLRVRVEKVTDEEVATRKELARNLFEFAESVNDEDFDWAARVSVGLDRLVEDFDLDSVAYYHRGLDGEIHERLGAGMILGSSLLTARGIPMAGEYEVRTTLAMLICDRIGAGGSFTELQALELQGRRGRNGPRRRRLTWRSARQKPLLRGLGVYHGKRGWGVSVEFDVTHGPVTTLGVGQERDGTLTFIASEGHVIGGPLLGDRQHDFACRLRLRPWSLDRCLERLRGGPPLGTGRWPPHGRLPCCGGSARRPIRRRSGCSRWRSQKKGHDGDRRPQPSSHTAGHGTRPSRACPAVHPKVALVAGGLGAYWPQFPELLVTLKASAVRISERLTELGADVRRWLRL